MPISQLLEAMDPPVPAEVKAAADDLRYRDFLTVALVVPDERVDLRRQLDLHPRPQGAHHAHPELRLVVAVHGEGGPQRASASSTRSSRATTSGPPPTSELIEQAKQELEQLGLVATPTVEAGYVVRQPKAYPIYDERYRANVDVLRGWLAEHAPNVHPVGRNGMFRYNNQDHSMFTAMLTVENIATGTTHDVWEVNVEEEYHEEVVGQGRRPTGRRRHGTGRDAPVIKRATIDAAQAGSGHQDRRADREQAGSDRRAEGWRVRVGSDGCGGRRASAPSAARDRRRDGDPAGQRGTTAQPAAMISSGHDRHLEA